MNKWVYPISHESIVLADMFDLNQSFYLALSKQSSKFKPHPARPWATGKKEHYGNTGGRSAEAVKNILQRAKTGAF